MTIIKVRENGPLRVEGDDVKVVDWNGNEYPIDKRPFVLCRCGQSKTRPSAICTHRAIGFQPPRLLLNPEAPMRRPSRNHDDRGPPVGMPLSCRRQCVCYRQPPPCSLHPRGIHGLPQPLRPAAAAAALRARLRRGSLHVQPHSHCDDDCRRACRPVRRPHRGRRRQATRDRDGGVRAGPRHAAGGDVAIAQQVIAWRFAQGIVTPGVFAVAVAFIHDRWEGARAATTTAAYVTGTVVGGFLGRVVSGQAAAMWGWRASFASIGVLSLGLCADARRPTACR